jgi:YD repeat-containing protein
VISSDRSRVVITTRSIVAIVLCTVLAPTRLLAQAPSIFYVYDELNRLVAVVDQQGNAATYTYDAVGNILRVDRFGSTGAPGGVAISLFTPGAGGAGATVQIFGRGFSGSIAQNSVFFDGHAAQIIAAAPNRLVAKVPTDATTGPLSVVTPAGSATSDRVFRVLGQLAITPQTASVRVTGRLAFTATENAVRWAVNGLTGGDSILGTISAEGVYTAPTRIPVPPAVTITATHREDATLNASAIVTIVPAFGLLLASRAVSVTAAAAPVVMDHSIGASISVLASASQSATLSLSTPVSVATEPVVLDLVPNTATSGATISLTISGRGLSGATSIVFLAHNAADPAVTVDDFVVNADGTAATARVAIATGATSGARVVQIVTPAAASSPAGTGANVFVVQ